MTFSYVPTANEMFVLNTAVAETKVIGLLLKRDDTVVETIGAQPPFFFCLRAARTKYKLNISQLLVRSAVLLLGFFRGVVGVDIPDIFGLRHLFRTRFRQFGL